jgi:thymidylate kinase|tara:strand:+ start:164 stop:292 length:129 start_codon:yes stop_codon:yes gene_type:complete
MAEHIKKTLAKLLAEWLKDDFDYLIDEPTYNDIEEALEESEE